jgi:hypothetical protein
VLSAARSRLHTKTTLAGLDGLMRWYLTAAQHHAAPRAATGAPAALPDYELAVLDELVLRHLEVVRRGPAADAAAAVVVAAVARAEPAVVVAGIGDRHAAEVRADAETDDPLRGRARSGESRLRFDGTGPTRRQQDKKGCPRAKKQQLCASPRPVNICAKCQQRPIRPAADADAASAAHTPPEQSQNASQLQRITFKP